MVQYLRSHTKRVTEDFIITPFKQTKKKKKEDEIQIYSSLNFGIYIIVPLLFGLGVGLFIDSRWGTKPIGILLGLLLGITGTFFNLIKIIQKFSHNARD